MIYDEFGESDETATTWDDFTEIPSDNLWWNRSYPGMICDEIALSWVDLR